MNTDKITENLYKNAVDSERQILISAATNYRNAIRLSGQNATIILGKEGETFETNVNRILEAITTQLLEKRNERIKTEAVTDFLNKFNAFSDYMHQMENYKQA